MTSKPNRTAVNRHIFQKAPCLKQWHESLGIAVTVAREESEEPEPAAAEGPDVPSRPASPAFFSHDVPDEDEEDIQGIDDFIPPPRAAPPEPEAAAAPPIPPSRRATVEEVLDDDDPLNLDRYIEAFPGEEEFPERENFVDNENAKTLGRGETLFERMHAEQKAAGHGPYAPFLDSDEWDLASWLSKNVSQTATDEYLKMPIVSVIIRCLLHMLTYSADPAPHQSVLS